MALIEDNILGETIDKVQNSIKILCSFEPPDGYLLAFSGGKDSVVLKHLADTAGVKYHAAYNATTVDPPELVRFIIKYYPDVEIVRPKSPMRKLIIKNQFPPTRIGRYCCKELKESTGIGKVTLTGVRWAESKNRKDNQGIVTVLSDKNSAKAAKDNGAIRSKRGGYILNYDDAPARRMVEQCYRTSKTLVNPIIGWTDEDVWEYIHQENIPYCSLYDEGFTRLGCVGCPLGGYDSMKIELGRWPAIKKMYIRAFDEMLMARTASGKKNIWKDGEDVMRWWVGDAPCQDDENQTNMFDGDDDEG